MVIYRMRGYRLDFKVIEGFGWNQGNLEHIKKHNVNQRECEEVFFNQPLIVTEDISHSQIEERFRVYGQTNENRLLFVIITIRNSAVRVISARDQSKKEQKEFKKSGDKLI